MRAHCLRFAVVAMTGTLAADEPRIFSASASRVLTADDSEGIRQECLDVLPVGLARPFVTVDLAQPWHHGRPDARGSLVASWTLVRATFFLHGVAIADAQSLFIFSATRGQLVACEHPTFAPTALAADPGLPTLSADEAVALVTRHVLGDAAGDYQVRAAPLVWSLEHERYTYTIVYAPRWHESAPVWQPEYWTPQWVLVDGQTGEFFSRGAIALRAPVRGTVSGHTLPLQGAAVRRAYGPTNREVLSPLAYVPLTLVLAGRADLGPQLSGPAGEFSFDLPTDGQWGLHTVWEGNDDFNLFVVAGTQLVEASAMGVGAQTVAVTLSAEPASARSQENAVGNVTGWQLLFVGKRFSQELQTRNFRWPTWLTEFTRGFPGWWPVEYIPLPAADDTLPILGVYMDAFPPVRKIGISEANNLFAHSSVPATWHELGHALLSAFTGQVNEGGFHSHNAIVEEGIADVWSVLMQQHADPEGGLTGDVGLGMEQGFVDSFHRNCLRGETCPHDADPATPCTPQAGHHLFPDFGEIHAASLPLSGLWVDLLAAFLERYGRSDGLHRMADLLIRWIDFHRGRHLPAFGRYGIFEILAISDNEDFGGDDNPFNGSPDADLIIKAAAARNFWLHHFARGDTNADGEVNLSDAMVTLTHLFLGAAVPACLDSADADDSGTVDLSDAVVTLTFLFLGGDSLPLPQQCGSTDPTPNDRLTCESFPTCPR